MRYSPVSKYGKEVASLYSDTDFDIGDTYTIPADYAVSAIYHSHGTAHLEIYLGASWVDIFDKDGSLYPGAGAEFRTVDGMPRSKGGTNAGSLRIAGSGANNTTLYVLMSYTERNLT